MLLGMSAPVLLAVAFIVHSYLRNLFAIYIKKKKIMQWKSDIGTALLPWCTVISAFDTGFGANEILRDPSTFFCFWMCDYWINKGADAASLQQLAGPENVPEKNRNHMTTHYRLSMRCTVFHSIYTILWLLWKSEAAAREKWEAIWRWRFIRVFQRAVLSMLETTWLI